MKTKTVARLPKWRAVVFASVGLIGALGACGQSNAFPDEVAAVQQLVIQFENALRASEANPSLSLEQAMEEFDCLQGWEDINPTGSLKEGFHFGNETVPLIASLVGWHRKNGESAGWVIDSSPQSESGQVIVSLPNTQRLEIELVQSELGWRVMRMDPVFQNELVRSGSAEEFAESFLARMLEIESAFLADGIDAGANAYYYMGYSGMSHERQFLAAWHDRVRREYLDNDPISDTLAIPVPSFLSAQHRAWAGGWDAQLRVLPAESYGDPQTFVRVDLIESKDPSRFGQPFSIQFELEKVGAEWALISLLEVEAIASYFEFRNDGQGNWNYQPPKSD